MIGNNKIIHFLSASDRVNFGDLLFPIIFLEVAKKEGLNLEFYNYGIIKSDLSHFGALPTLSYRQFQKNIDSLCGNIIIGGGEVLFVDWSSLLSYISFRFSRILRNKTVYKIEKKMNLAKYYLSNGQVLVPFAPDISKIKSSNVKLIFNAVGGSFENTKIKNKDESLKKSLLSATYISVRDQRVVKSLKKKEVNSLLSPDSALILSDIFNTEYLKGKTSITETPDKYIFLQLGIYNAPKDLQSFSNAILKIADSLRVTVVLCPIGMAARHEDNIVLRKIEKMSTIYKYYIPKSIFDIMHLISNSIIYLGSSLHGLITAQSYSVPFIALNKKQIKVNSYCRTWAFAENCIDFGDESDITEIFTNWDEKKYKKNLKKQKTLVYQNFERIFSHLV